MAAQVNLDYQTFWTPRQIGRPRRVDTRMACQAFASERQSASHSPDCHHLNAASMVPEELLGSSQGLESGKEDFICLPDDAASNMSDVLNDELFNDTLPSVQAIVQSLEEVENRGSIVSDVKQMSDCEHEAHYKHRREVTYRLASSTSPDHTIISPSPERMSGELAADLTVGDSSCASRICAPASTSMPATSRTNTPSPQSESWDTASARTSRTSLLAAYESTDEPNMQSTTQRYSPHVVENDSRAQKYTYGQPTSATSRMTNARHGLQHKRRREVSLGNDNVRFDAEDPPWPLGDAEYCQSTSHETEESRDGQFTDDDEPPHKRRKHRPIRRISRSLSEDGACHDSPDLHQAADPASSTTPKHLDTTNLSGAAFDEWNLQDVVLKRTIVDGRATFSFQFDWDMCMTHSQETGKPRKWSTQQGRGKSGSQSNRRRTFTEEEEQWLAIWKEKEGLSWADIHRRFCDQFEERSKESLQVRYCTKLKHRDGGRQELVRTS